MKENIAFTGMMGCGKTTVSQELSKVLTNYTLVDIDKEIEKSSGKKISEIFLKFGEPHFRMLESEKIKNCVQNYFPLHRVPACRNKPENTMPDGSVPLLQRLHTGQRAVLRRHGSAVLCGIYSGRYA